MMLVKNVSECKSGVRPAGVVCLESICEEHGWKLSEQDRRQSCPRCGDGQRPKIGFLQDYEILQYLDAAFNKIDKSLDYFRIRCIRYKKIGQLFAESNMA